MILKNKYNQAMDHIVVTSEMETRILKKLSTTSIDAPVLKKRNIASYTRKLAIAACFLVVVIGGSYIHRIAELPISPPVATVNNQQVFDSYEELSEAVEYEVKAPTVFSTKDSEISYLLLDQNFVEITYSSDQNTINYRMDKGIMDISGDYSVYTEISEISIDEWSVELRGDQEGYRLAVWNDGEYSYAISSELPISIVEMSDMIRSIQ
jgi:hypothetical protein